MNLFNLELEISPNKHQQISKDIEVYYKDHPIKSITNLKMTLVCGAYDDQIRDLLINDLEGA